MSEKDVANLIKNTWKSLALADQTDAEVVKTILTELLDNLDAMQAEE